MVNIVLTPTHNEAITAGHIGTVNDVIAGHVPKNLAKLQFNAGDFKYGFELASPDGIASLGETVLVNDYCYTTSTDPQTSHYLQTISGKSFVTSGIFLIPLEAHPTYLIKQSFGSTCLLNDFYEALFAKIKQPFAFAASFEFETLYGTFVAKAPINEENIFDHPESYYSCEPQTLTDVSAFLVGAIADYGDSQYKSLLEKLAVVLYNNPFDKQQGITSHAHGITLKKHIDQVRDITPAVVDKTLHVFSDKSRIKSIVGEIYTISDMKDYSSKK